MHLQHLHGVVVSVPIYKSTGLSLNSDHDWLTVIIFCGAIQIMIVIAQPIQLFILPCKLISK